MNEGSLLKRTLVVTGALVGVSAAWIALVSVVLVTLVGRATSSPGGASDTSARLAPSAPEAPHAAARNHEAPAPLHARTTTSKPNG